MNNKNVDIFEYFISLPSFRLFSVNNKCQNNHFKYQEICNESVKVSCLKAFEPIRGSGAA